MNFNALEYIDWFKKKPEAKYDLCRSGVEDVSLKDLNINFDNLEISGKHGFGYPPLIESIASKYRVSGSNIILTQGASHAIFVVCAALIDKGEVVVEKPVYGPLVDVPKSLGARIVFCEREFSSEYRFEPGRLQSLISSKTQLILLTNPHNPSGTFLSKFDMMEIVEVSEKFDIPVVVDEIYLDFLKNPEEKSSFGLSKNIIIISSLTKVYGLGGLRCGWIAARPDLIEVIKPLIDYTIVEGVFMGEQVSAQVFGQLEDIKSRKKDRTADNMQLLRDSFKREIKLSWCEPPGGVICFPRVEANISSDDLAGILKKEYDTAIVPGRFFGAPQHFRIGFDLEKGLLKKALENIRNALSVCAP
jgi:aspartate/methionine/tyrosine aminotransferase